MTCTSLMRRDMTSYLPTDHGLKCRLHLRSNKFFKKCRISLLALIRMLQHAKKGGNIEVMGYFSGRIQGDTFIVLDAFPLPVEGTETRVNAGREAEEYTARLDELSEQMNKKERVNPANGICLSPLYDKIFDKGFMTLNDNFTIILSKRLLKIVDKKVYANFFGAYENQKINLPDKFFPKTAFLEFHRKNIFKN